MATILTLAALPPAGVTGALLLARPNRHGVAAVVVEHGPAQDADGGTDVAPLVARYEVDTFRYWCDDDPVVEVVAFSRALPGVSLETMATRYRAHADLARYHHPGICRYEQAYVRAQHGDDDRPCHVIARLGFASDEARITGMARDADSTEIVLADVDTYLDRPAIWSLVCDVGPDGARSRGPS